MADDLEAELSALEDKAPLTEADTEAEAFGPGNPKPEDVAVGAKEETEGEPAAEEWKPPTKEHWENIQKAQREAREQARAAKRQAQLYEQNMAAIEQRVQAWQQQQIAQRLQQPAPDPYENPEAARAWAAQQQQFQQQLWLAQQQREAQEAQRFHQERQFEQLTESVNDYESEFAKTNPDYHEATEHMLGIQQQILENAGYPPDVAAQQVAMWSASIAEQALRANRNPAEFAYNMAQKMGYVPASKRNGGAQAAADKLAAIKAGQGSAQTLSGGGAASAGSPSLKSIANLEGAAFDSALDKFLTRAIKGL